MSEVSVNYAQQRAEEVRSQRQIKSGGGWNSVHFHSQKVLRVKGHQQSSGQQQAQDQYQVGPPSHNELRFKQAC